VLPQTLHAVSNIDISSNLLHIHTVKSEIITQVNETKTSDESAVVLKASRCVVSVVSTPSNLRVLIQR
jgi:hypothetical protein